MPQGGPAQLCVCVCGEFEALIDVINKPQVAVAAATSNCKKIQMYLQAALTATCNVSLLHATTAWNSASAVATLTFFIVLIFRMCNYFRISFLSGECVAASKCICVSVSVSSLGICIFIFLELGTLSLRLGNENWHLPPPCILDTFQSSLC